MRFLSVLEQRQPSCLQHLRLLRELPPLSCRLPLEPPPSCSLPLLSLPLLRAPLPPQPASETVIAPARTTDNHFFFITLFLLKLFIIVIVIVFSGKFRSHNTSLRIKEDALSALLQFLPAEHGDHLLVIDQRAANHHHQKNQSNGNIQVLLAYLEAEREPES